MVIFFFSINRYDIVTLQKFGSESRVTLPVTLDRVPVFQREGSIIPRKMRIRRSTVAMKNDPYTLVVIADGDGKATGNLYIDDEASFEYRHGKYLYLRLNLEGKKLTSTFLHKLVAYTTKSWLERVDILNPPQGITKAVLHSKGKFLVPFLYHFGKTVIQNLQETSFYLHRVLNK